MVWVTETRRRLKSETKPQTTFIIGDKHLAPYFLAKRVFDATAALALLILLAPLIIILAIIIKLDSPGPVLFVQKRVGSKRQIRAGKAHWEVQPFRMYKFRTMVHNADDALHRQHIVDYVAGRLQVEDGKNGALKLTNDPRITRAGQLLRKTSLDELPQLFNVLKGEMSLVGPRPVPEYEYECYEPWHCERLCALPGITGLWQVEGRCLVSFDEQIKLDIEYVRNQSFMLDLQLLLRTIPAVLSGRGAR